MINVIKASIGCLLVSLLLQLVAITTPGWYAIRHDNNIGTTSITSKTFVGVFYYIICTDGECDTKSIVDEDLKGRSLYWFVSFVCNILITLVMTVLAVIMRFLVLNKRGDWTPTFTALSMTFLSVANTLQWQMVADFGNRNVLDQHGDITVIFPWCVLVHGIGALLVSAVILADLYMLISTERRSSPSNFPSAPITNMTMP